MEIAHPKRILLLAPTGVSSSSLLSVLTESAGPGKSGASNQTTTPESSELQSQPVHLIANSYYRATVPVWTDEVLSTDAWAAQWKAEDGAAEVIRAVGAWIVCFHKPATDEAKHAITTLLTTVSSVLSHHESSLSSSYSAFDSDSILIALAVPSQLVSSSEPEPFNNSNPPSELDLELDDLCRAAGNWEYIDGTRPRRTHNDSNRSLNDYGETEGIDRLLEALQGGEWDAADDEEDGGLDVFDDLDEEPEGEHFMGDIATGFGELLAAGAASRGGLLDTGGHNELDNTAGHDLDQSLARQLDDVDDGDETWTVRGPKRAPIESVAKTDHGFGDGATGVTNLEGLGLNSKGIGAGADGETDEDVQALQNMMARLQAAKDLGADLPAAERRKLAKEAVRGVMRDM